MIIRGGYNLYPRETQEALHERPAAALAAVVGVRLKDDCWSFALV
ncbi:hypothetical protein [Streptomyces sp. TRM72054]|nr:hypothetical protein [Streptomyces sp. TRM72054]